jgi:hypothetical protein
MNYEKNYNDLMEHAKSKSRVKYKPTDPRFVYYEAHHIIPKCFGGAGKSRNHKHPNIVLLTAREHFLAHFLLCKIYEVNGDKNKFYRMSKAFARFKKPETYNKMNARLYESIRIKLARVQSELTKGKVTTSPESRARGLITRKKNFEILSKEERASRAKNARDAQNKIMEERQLSLYGCLQKDLPRELNIDTVQEAIDFVNKYDLKSTYTRRMYVNYTCPYCGEKGHTKLSVFIELDEVLCGKCRGAKSSGKRYPRLVKNIECIETGIVYSIKEIIDLTGLAECSVIDCLRGRKAHCGGYHWKYV